MNKILVSMLLTVAVAGCGRSRNLILLENNSEKICTSVVVSVCDSVWTVKNMMPGAAREFAVVYTADDSFQVYLEFSEGDSLQGNFGYVTHGVSGDRIRISIENDSISFRQSGSEY